MSLPQAVLDSEKEAEELWKKMYEEKEEKEDPPKEEEVVVEDKSPEPEEEEKQETVATEAVEATEEPASDTVPRADYDRLKAQHDTLQGKYKAEVPRQAETIKLQDARISLLEAKLAAVESSPKKDVAPDEDEDLSGVYSQIENDFGAEFAANFRKAARAEAKMIANETLKSVRGDIENLGKTVVSSQEEKFLTNLTSLNKNWRTTFDDPRFIEMLREIEPFSGKQYGDLAQEANDAMDAKRLAKIYDMFDSRIAAETAKETPPTKPKPNKEALITPTTASKSTVDSESKEEYFKAEDVEQFYQDMALGRYSDRPKESREIEARINEAISKRRIIG